MDTQTWSSRWWEIAVAVLAVNSVIFGVLAIGSDHTGWAIATGFGPAVLLVIGLALVGRWRVGATVILIVASLAAATWFWMVYPAVLAGIVVIGGLNSGHIGPIRPQTAPSR
jgi:hypothetical protein